MRALIVSSDRFEDSELSEPLQQLQAKGVEVDIAAPQQGPITGKHGHRVSAGLALSAVRAEDYELLLPGGEAPASLRRSPRRWPSPGISFRPTSPWPRSATGRSS